MSEHDFYDLTMDMIIRIEEIPSLFKDETPGVAVFNRVFKLAITNRCTRFSKKNPTASR